VSRLVKTRETWVPIVNYDRYLVSDKGRIKSKRRKSEIILKPLKTKFGYYRVRLFNDNGSRWLSIHRLVAEAFISNPGNLPEVNHKDEDKTNNRVNNLEWCDGVYNTNYGTRNKRAGAVIKELRKIPVAQYRGETLITIWDSAKIAGENLNLNASNITKCCKGKRKSSGGFEWKYARK
jgi:hypothetical protein